MEKIRADIERAGLSGRVLGPGDTDYDTTRALFSGNFDTWERLQAIKAKYDPTNLFRLNQNITPATANH